jgi:branched-chain amino acid transport system substrate-binding protein
VVLNFTPPEALKILSAATKLGLQDRVVTWGCSTPCNTNFVADALGAKWNGKLGVNAELNVTDFNGPDSALYRDVLEKYGKKVAGGLGSFSQMGFVLGDIATKALLGIEGDITVESANAAIKATKGYKTDILCKPWYYGDAPAHIPNNTDWTTTPKDGKMVVKEDCFPIDAADPDIAKIRAIEKEQGIE